MLTRAVMALVLALSVVRGVRAEESADEAKKAAVLEQARQHVAKAKVHYDLGEFKEAAEEYIIVYRLRPIPALLFNIAQSFRQAGLYDKARQFYRSYLRESPDVKNRAMIEQSIREMDSLLAKERRTRDAPPTGVKEPPEASLPIVAQKAAEPAPAKPAAEPVKPPAPQAVAAKPAVAPEKPAAEKAPVVAMATPRAAVPQAATSKPWTQPVAEEETPLYKKWWLWTAVGVVAIGAGAAAMTMGGNSAPGSHFGTTPVFP